VGFLASVTCLRTQIGSETILKMEHLSSALSAASSTPWWAVPAATLSGVLITVAATVTLEFLRARRERDTRLFDERRQTYASIADLMRRQMILLNDGSASFYRGAKVTVPEEVRKIHREAAIIASLIGSSELVDVIDSQYQCSLEVWGAMWKSQASNDSPPDSEEVHNVGALRNRAEEQALRVINVLREDTGVPGKLQHQWF
jgi:hypothetical protein